MRTYYNCTTEQGGDCMAKESTLQVRMDSDLKEQVENLYKEMGSSFAEAVRIFAKQSVAENAMPFRVHVPVNKQRNLGIANGKYIIPDNIDADNDVISEMFGV